MGNALIISWLALTFLLSTGPGLAPQNADSKQKDQPEITFEMVRSIVLEIQKKAQEARERGNELTELDALRAMQAEYATRGLAAHKAIATMLLTLNPILGNYREALHYGDVGLSKQSLKQPTGEDRLKGYKPVDAIAALARVAGAAQIIMINEAHHVPQHRAFTIELLKVLRHKGFTYFAAEDLNEKDTHLNERGYPTTQTGYYTAEPVYGDLIRTALKLGYRVVAYEPPFQNADQRERGQARNLVDRILKHDPKGKILVHAGYSHIDESGTRTGAITMAQRLKEMTGIDPVTIDQTEMTERSALEYEHPLYRFALARGLVSQPTVFQNARGELWALDKSLYDLTLFHPRSLYVEGRPMWLRLNGSRSPYRLPEDVCGKSARCLVRARVASEAAGAIPIDELEVHMGRKVPALMLPKGEFVIEVQDPEGKQITTLQVKTNRP